MNAGYKASLTHAQKGSIKTNASPSVVWDMMRGHVKANPVKPGKEDAPATKLLGREVGVVADFTLHAESVAESKKGGLVRFQENPTANWGPKSKAKKEKEVVVEGGEGHKSKVRKVEVDGKSGDEAIVAVATKVDSEE